MSEHNSGPSVQLPDQWASLYLPAWISDEDVATARSNGHYLSPRLQADPAATLDTLAEVTEFVGQWPEARLAAAKESYDQLQDSGGPLSMTLRAAAIVPVAFDENRRVLSRTIEQYAGQDVEPGSWLVSMLVNRVANGSPDVPEEIAADIRDTAAASETPLHVSRRSYDAGTPMGRIRADGFDPILYHIAHRGLRQRVLGISNDADIADMSRDYTRQFTAALEHDPTKEFVTSRMLWEQPGGRDTSMSRVIRYFSALDNLLRTTTPHSSITEANMGIDLGLYAATGGFLRSEAAEQMAQLRASVGQARTGNNPDPVVRRTAFSDRTAFVNSVFLRTASRRLQLAFSQSFGPHEAWGEDAVPFSTGNDAMDRSRDLETFPTELEPDTQAKLLEGIDGFYGPIITSYIDPIRFKKATKLARSVIGLPDIAS